jgi:hypothetical protein
MDLEGGRKYLEEPNGTKPDLGPSLFQGLGLVLDAIRQSLKHWLRQKLRNASTQRQNV